MSESKRKNKPVYFSKSDPHELELLEFVEQINPLTGKPQNFSKYMKRLIEEEMKRKKQGGHNDRGGYTIIDVENDEDENYTIDVKEAMDSFMDI